MTLFIFQECLPFINFSFLGYVTQCLAPVGVMDNWVELKQQRRGWVGSLRVETPRLHSQSSSVKFNIILKQEKLSRQYFVCKSLKMCFVYCLFHLPKNKKQSTFPLSCFAPPSYFYRLSYSLMYLPLAASRLLSEKGIFFKQKSSFTH